MNIVTVNVGQGAMAVLRHESEAIIVDCKIPPRDDSTVGYVKEILAVSLKNHYLRGFILTGFDCDHSDIQGASIILRKYRPDWVMYPTYYKDTQETASVFELIDGEIRQRANSAAPLRRLSVRMDKLPSRILPNLSPKFSFELFAPHLKDMTSSNNSSIVMKVTGNGSRGFSYLITGDTESDQWERLHRQFGAALKSHVLAAPHHGSKNAVHSAALLDIDPHTVLISAGVDSQYGHPSPEALRVYSAVAKYVYSTNSNGGVTLLTRPGKDELITTQLRRLEASAAV